MECPSCRADVPGGKVKNAGLLDGRGLACAINQRRTSSARSGGPSNAFASFRSRAHNYISFLDSSRESCCLSAEEAFLSGIAVAQQQKTRRGAA